MSQNRHTVYDVLGRHPIHPFPARMAPGIALNILADAERPLRVLDPMMGSGTVLAMARAYGHRASGVDLDPLAVLLARVWTTAYDENDLIEEGREVLASARTIFSKLPVADAYPRRCSEDTRKFIRYWFDDYARRQLASLVRAIQNAPSEATREALWCAFSRLIITKSSGASLAMDLSHSRPHRAFERAPTKPFDAFGSAVAIVAKNCVAKSAGRGPQTRTVLGDARNLKDASNSFDLVLTSPPYLNAIDYMRCSKFSLVWMGFSVDQVRVTRTASVGSETSLEVANDDEDVKIVVKELKLKQKLSERNTAILSRYVWDMRSALQEAARVLVKGGEAVYVVGDSTIRGTYIRNSEIVRLAAESNGLELIKKQSRSLPANRRYLPPPQKNQNSASLDKRMRKEVVLQFRK